MFEAELAGLVCTHMRAILGSSVGCGGSMNTYYIANSGLRKVTVIGTQLLMSHFLGALRKSSNKECDMGAQ